MAININTFGYGVASISIALSGVLVAFGSKYWFWFLIVGFILGLISILK